MDKRVIVLLVATFLGACMQDTKASKACETSGTLSDCKACCHRNGATGSAFRENHTTKMCICTM